MAITKTLVTNLLSAASIDGVALIGTDANNINCGRLCLATGAPDTIDQTASTTLYFTPYKGNLISLITGGVNVVKTFTEQSIDVSALTAAKPYDIFAYWDTGTSTVKIEALVWTNDTTRATAIALTNGIYYKSGDTTRKYLGTIYTYDDDGTVKTRDEASYRYVDNFYNKIKKSLDSHNSLEYWTYDTTALRELNNGTNQIRANFINGLERSLIVNFACGIETLANKKQAGGVAIGYDAVNTACNGNISISGIETTWLAGDAIGCINLILKSVIGLHFLTGLEIVYAADSSSITFGYKYNSNLISSLDC